MSSNLPPGVGSGSIPGNRGEDIAWEKLAEELSMELDRLQIFVSNDEGSTQFEQLLDWFWKKLEAAESGGYKQGWQEGQAAMPQKGID
jgi:hypothetical protein